MRNSSLSALAPRRALRRARGADGPEHRAVATSLAKPLWVGQAPGDNSTPVRARADPGRHRGRHQRREEPAAVPRPDGKVSSAGNERGLLGLAFDPDFANNGFLYVYYTRAGDFATVVERYTAIDADHGRSEQRPGHLRPDQRPAVATTTAATSSSARTASSTSASATAATSTTPAQATWPAATRRRGRDAARQDAAHRQGRHASRGDNPFVGDGAVRARDLGPRPAQPVALQLRPR